MSFSITITVNLDNYNTSLYQIYTSGTYSEVLNKITDDLHDLSGVEQVCFGHMSWVEFNLGTDDFIEAKEETDKVLKEIEEVFEKYGVKL